MTVALLVWMVSAMHLRRQEKRREQRSAQQVLAEVQRQSCDDKRRLTVKGLSPSTSGSDLKQKNFAAILIIVVGCHRNWGSAVLASFRSAPDSMA